MSRLINQEGDNLHPKTHVKNVYDDTDRLDHILEQKIPINRRINGRMLDDDIDFIPSDFGAGYPSIQYLFNIPPNAWTGNEAPFIASISFNGIMENSIGEIGLQDNITDEAFLAASSANMRFLSYENNNVLRFKALGDKPTVNIPISLILTKGDTVVLEDPVTLESLEIAYWNEGGINTSGHLVTTWPGTIILAHFSNGDSLDVTDQVAFNPDKYVSPRTTHTLSYSQNGITVTAEIELRAEKGTGELT